MFFATFQTKYKRRFEGITAHTKASFFISACWLALL